MRSRSRSRLGGLRVDGRLLALVEFEPVVAGVVDTRNPDALAEVGEFAPADHRDVNPRVVTEGLERVAVRGGDRRCVGVGLDPRERAVEVGTEEEFVDGMEPRGHRRPEVGGGVVGLTRHWRPSSP